MPFRFFRKGAALVNIERVMLLEALLVEYCSSALYDTSEFKVGFYMLYPVYLSSSNIEHIVSYP